MAGSLSHLQLMVTSYWRSHGLFGLLSTRAGSKCSPLFAHPLARLFDIAVIFTHHYRATEHVLPVRNLCRHPCPPAQIAGTFRAYLETLSFTKSLVSHMSQILLL